MKNLLTPFWIHLAALLLLSFSGPNAVLAQEILADQNAKKKEAFVLLQSEMIDMNAFFVKYAIPAEVVVNAHNGHALVATFDKKVLEGAWNNNWTIVLKFPSLKAASDWYYSDKYQALIPYRHAATAFGNMVMFEGTPESVMNWSVTEYDGIAPALRFPLTLDTTPEYIVTVSPSWGTSQDRFVVSAIFSEVNYVGANLSLEMKMPASYVNDGQLEVQVIVKDTAGRRVRLGTLWARDFNADQWYNLQFVGNGVSNYVTQATNLSKINAVEIEFSAGRKPVQVSGDIQIRNLRISK